MHHCLNKTDICIFLTYQESQGQWLRWDVGSTTSLGTQALSDSLCFPGVALLLLYIQCCCSLLIWKNGFQIWLHTSHSFAVVVQSVSHVWLFVIPWTAARQASLSFTIFWSLLKFMSFESVMPSNHLILWDGCTVSWQAERCSSQEEPLNTPVFTIG